jgi:hypothetical protein
MRVQGDLVISPTTSWEADIQAPVQMRGIEMLSYVEGSVQEGAEIAQVVLSDPMGDQMQFLVRAGIDTDNADPDPGNALIPRQEIAVVLPEGTPDWVPYWLLPGYLGVQTRKYYLTRLNFSRPCSPNEIEIRYLQDSGNLHLGSLIYIPQNNEPIEP